MSEKELIDYIKKYFIYNEDGTFTRTDRRNSTGSFDKDGYLIIKIKGKQYKAHRLVFAYFNNRFPKKEIDHINRDRKDNRIENLREVNRTENVRNTTKKINPDTGVYGVYKDKSTKGLKKVYTFHFQDKSYRFYTVEEAVNKRKELYGEL
jgi:hypothetical protein